MTQVMSPPPNSFGPSNFEPSGNFDVSSSSFNNPSFGSNNASFGSSGGYDRMDNDESIFSNPGSLSDHSHILANDDTDDMDMGMMDFLSIPTPTARLLNSEFLRKNSQID